MIKTLGNYMGMVLDSENGVLKDRLPKGNGFGIWC